MRSDTFRAVVVDSELHANVQRHHGVTPPLMVTGSFIGVSTPSAANTLNSAMPALGRSMGGSAWRRVERVRLGSECSTHTSGTGTELQSTAVPAQARKNTAGSHHQYARQ